MYLLDQVYLHFEELTPLENVFLPFQILQNVMVINNFAFFKR